MVLFEVRGISDQSLPRRSATEVVQEEAHVDVLVNSLS